MSLQSVTTWVFDLDNTLYPREARLFDQIQILMEDFICEFLSIERAEARELRSTYWKTHGTTLRGMMDNHAMPPDAFLNHVHNIDLSHLENAPDLAAEIAALPGRKIVYTNGSRKHAQRVTAARGLDGLFDAMYGIEHADYIPKPHAKAYAHIIARDGFDPAHAAMFEDEERNLEVPRSLGMGTILVGEPKTQGYTEHQTDNLTAFLSQLNATLSGLG